jgi:hypothetical protein
MRTRREFLGLLALAGGAFGLSGHAPYRQWVVYREEHLMIVASRREAESFPLTQAVVEDLGRAVPDAKPAAARAPTTLHISRLIESRQIDVAVLTEAEARDLSRGTGECAEQGAVPIRLLALLRGGHVLVCNAAFERDRAYIVVFGLFDEAGSPALAAEYRTLAGISERALALGIPLHVGAREFLLEREKPPA